MQHATPTNAPAGGLLQRLVMVRPGEGRALWWAAAYFFFLLLSYYLLRPVRDAVLELLDDARTGYQEGVRSAGGQLSIGSRVFRRIPSDQSI